MMVLALHALNCPPQKPGLFCLKTSPRRGTAESCGDGNPGVGGLPPAGPLRGRGGWRAGLVFLLKSGL